MFKCDNQSKSKNTDMNTSLDGLHQKRKSIRIIRIIILYTKLKLIIIQEIMFIFIVKKIK